MDLTPGGPLYCPTRRRSFATLARHRTPVLKAYLEPNVVNWARRSSWSGTDLRKALNARGLDPHFGIHGVYELARGFLDEQNTAEAQRNFTILSDLDPVFGPTPATLFEKELDRLRTGAIVIPVLDELNRASVRQQVIQMAAGRLEPAGREFLHRREASIDRDIHGIQPNNSSKSGGLWPPEDLTPQIT
jgi:hypothetical protein